ncbi:MAG: DUF3027 domain-containing protein [Cellulomonas sp.]|jgi:hypothetical protein|nr:DUF3027 domain-containing protein [Cellulomonas sp.]
MTKDAVLDRAVDLARAAAEDVAEDPAAVGEYLGTTWEADRLVTHRFACESRGYQGWQWTVTLARVPRGRSATVCEAVLLPGDGALLARPWVPWAERLRPGDLGVGDVLPFRPDDPRLEPGWKPSGDPDADDAALVPVEELALARERVLAPLGRNETAARWYRGTHGPTSAGALAATAACATCGFLVPMSGTLSQVFGVCANEWSPDDGSVVSLDHGCGAHSQTDADPEPSQWPTSDPLIDDNRVDVVNIDRPDQALADTVAPEPAPGEEPTAVEEVGAMTSTPDETPDNPAEEPAEPPVASRPTGQWDGPQLELDPEDPGHLTAMASRRSCRVIPADDPEELADELPEPPERAPQE